MSSDPRLTKVLASAVLLAGGLGLVILGGCFLVGVMILLTGTGLSTQLVTFVWTPALYGLLVLLGILAIACFGGATLLIFLALQGLLKILTG
jgi:hypothetical protein